MMLEVGYSLSAGVYRNEKWGLGFGSTLINIQIRMGKIRCVCGAEMEPTKIDLNLGEITLKGVNAFHCPECDEDLMTTTQLISAFRAHTQVVADIEE